MSGALDGIRVVDFGQYLPGPLATMLLADAGADVIRVDPPGGPLWQHHANAMLQRGKRSLVLDLKNPSDRQIAQRVIATADAVVENFSPGVMDRFGLGASSCCEADPRLIYCSMPGFPSDDPRAGVPGWEGVVAAAAGLYLPGTWDGSPDPAPVYNPIPLASNFAALRAAQAIVGALIVREKGGAGQRIEVPLFDATFELKFSPHRRGNARPRQPRRTDFDLLLDTHFECADGRFVNLSWLEGRQLGAFADMVGLADDLDRDGLLDESKLWSNGFHTDELRRRLIPEFKTRTAAEWARTANPAADLSNCLTTQEWLHAEEHALTSGAVVSVVDPDYGPAVQAGAAFTMSKTPPRVNRPRHRLGSDRSAILADLGVSQRKQIPSGEQPPELPLSGVRVVDATQILAGPTCGRILAEYGADVIKINAPVGHPVTGHTSLNAGKRTILLDVKAPEGLDVFDRLIATSDVFLMNFAPQTAERLHVTEHDVRQHRADIIYTCVSCYGWDGPRGTHRGHEQMGQAVTGMQERWGRGLGLPVMQSMPICDLGTGNLAALATLLAVYHRLRTGEGQFVSASLAHTATFHQIPFMIDYDGRGWEDDPAGQQCRGLTPLYRLYRASDRWFFLAGGATDGLATVHGLEGVDLSSADELSARFARAPAAIWVDRLRGAGIGAHINCTPAEAMESAGSLVEERELPDLGSVLIAGPSGRFSLTPPRRTAVPRPAGGDNAEVLAELGMNAAYENLLANRVMATEVKSTLARPRA
ncbi:MAG: CoA transferase [Chloroflexi bacterium]|nr:CoA transferase [Chloroflexota bacterium]